MNKERLEYMHSNRRRDMRPTIVKEKKDYEKLLTYGFLIFSSIYILTHIIIWMFKGCPLIGGN